MPLKELHRQVHKSRKDIAADVVKGALAHLDKTTDPPVNNDGLRCQNDKERENRPVDAVSNSLFVDRASRLQCLHKGSDRAADELAEIIGKSKGEPRRDKKCDDGRKEDRPIAIEVSVEGECGHALATTFLL